MKPIRVLIADDHKIVLEGIQRLLEEEFDLVACVEDGWALVTKTEELKPDVVVVDISMPLLNGIEAVKQIKESLPKVKVVFLTMLPDIVYAIQAFKAGAQGYVLKNSASSELITAINEVNLGNTYTSPMIAKELERYNQKSTCHSSQRINYLPAIGLFLFSDRKHHLR